MAQPPKNSRTYDSYDHHTSPTGNKPQTQAPVSISPKPQREITGTIRTHKLPDPVIKHTNPVGRPKLPRD